MLCRGLIRNPAHNRHLGVTLGVRDTQMRTDEAASRGKGLTPHSIVGFCAFVSEPTSGRDWVIRASLGRELARSGIVGSERVQQQPGLVRIAKGREVIGVRAAVMLAVPGAPKFRPVGFSSGLDTDRARRLDFRRLGGGLGANWTHHEYRARSRADNRLSDSTRSEDPTVVPAKLRSAMPVAAVRIGVAAGTA